MGTVMTFRQLDEASRAFAAWLQKVAGLKRGDRVALMMPNLLQYPVAMFGALRAGMVVVNVNPLYTPRELEHQLNDSGAVAIVVLENFAHTLEQVIRATPVRVVVTTQVGDLLPPLRRVLTNAVVKYAKKMVPRWRLDGRDRLQSRARRGPRAVARRTGAHPGRPCLPAVHGRHDRRGQGRHADPRQHGGQRAAGRRVDVAEPRATASKPW